MRLRQVWVSAWHSWLRRLQERERLVTWSPEELVKQLRYPRSREQLLLIGLMRDAADMIDLLSAPDSDYWQDEAGRLRTEMAARQNGLDVVAAELDETSRQRDEARRVADEIAVEREAAWDAVARVRELCELAIRDRDSGVGIEDIVNAIEGNQP